MSSTNCHYVLGGAGIGPGTVKLPTKRQENTSVLQGEQKPATDKRN
jgi:hypothetical protein